MCKSQVFAFFFFVVVLSRRASPWGISRECLPIIVRAICKFPLFFCCSYVRRHGAFRANVYPLLYVQVASFCVLFCSFAMCAAMGHLRVSTHYCMHKSQVFAFFFVVVLTRLCVAMGHSPRSRFGLGTYGTRQSRALRFFSSEASCLRTSVSLHKTDSGNTEKKLANRM